MVVANTGVTDRMCPDRLAFVSYHPKDNLNVCMGNKTLPSVLSKGMAVILLNDKHIIVRNIFHVPALHTPLYSLHNHLTHHDCGFFGDDCLGGLFVYLPVFVLLVHSTTEHHLC